MSKYGVFSVPYFPVFRLNTDIVNLHKVMIKNTHFFALIVSYLQRLEIYVFSPNTGKYGPENTPYLDTFHAVLVSVLTDVDKQYFYVMLMRNTRVKYFTAQEMKIFIKDFFSKCNQILKKLRI